MCWIQTLCTQACLSALLLLLRRLYCLASWKITASGLVPTQLSFGYRMATESS